MQIQTFFRQDPYALNHVATHRLAEFAPVKRQPLVESWVDCG